MIYPIIRRSRPRVEPVLKLLPVPNPKPKLEMVRLPVFRVKQKHLEAYIASIYRFDFDFLIATGQTPGMMIEFKVDGMIPSETWGARAHELRCGKRTSACGRRGSGPTPTRGCSPRRRQRCWPSWMESC